MESILSSWEEGKPIRIKAKNIPEQLKGLWEEGEEMNLIPMVRSKDEVYTFKSYRDVDGKIIPIENRIPKDVARKGTVLSYIIRKDDGTGYYTSTIRNLVGYKRSAFDYLFDKV